MPYHWRMWSEIRLFRTSSGWNVSRVAAFPISLTPGQFVDQLFLNARLTPAASDRSTAINEFGPATTTADVGARSRALPDVAENSTLSQQEINRSFVVMQYLGYLRSSTNDPQ